MDPYVILTCRTQEQKSSVAKGAGSEPEWNETFIFTVSDDTPQLHLKIMDSDITADDFVGEAAISLEALFQEGSLPPTVHPVVKEEKYCGEIKLALTFTPEVVYHYMSLETSLLMQQSSHLAACITSQCNANLMSVLIQETRHHDSSWN
ncbi:hypothetical protein HU200_006820 [Digitaria exilis]|uniref:C2 domain-containing protein n=1 Tax=Digitaria exilis TaxID=1010633 RepID=A0A835FPN5_9POAL|nr:hypothetical protein HU200_006820 [Digitaria exilis]